MIRSTKTEFTESTNKALNCQKHFDQYGFPFTLNPTVGCSFTCKYCYSPIFVAKVPTGKRKQFFENIRIKLDIATQLDEELTRYKWLPQHLKRVQINETSEYYLPRVVNKLSSINRDLMGEILAVFRTHAANGNHWMLHILSKSNLILTHIAEFQEMRNMIQIEFSFATHDETIRRQIEFFTIPTRERLKVIEQLANAGIFVRIMAMPFFGEDNDLDILKTMTFNVGAVAFKNKGLNYYDWTQLSSLTYDDLVDDKIERTGGRPDAMNLNYIVKSGETQLIGGISRTVNLAMPTPRSGTDKLMDWTVQKANRLIMQDVDVIDCGYSMISQINWEYIV